MPAKEEGKYVCRTECQPRWLCWIEHGEYELSVCLGAGISNWSQMGVALTCVSFPLDILVQDLTKLKDAVVGTCST